MKLVDTHSHIQFTGFKEDADSVMQRALDLGVVVFNVGTHIGNSMESVKMTGRYPKGVYSVVGLHPDHTYSKWMNEEDDEFYSREEGFDYEAYKKLAMHPKVVGIGECGFDYYRLIEGTELQIRGGEKFVLTKERIQEIKQQQKSAFEAQIKLALELDKVLCIHCRPSPGTRDAYEDILAILYKLNAIRHTIRFEIHCFTGDWPTAQKFLDLGGYIALNGILTFDKTGVLAEVARNCPIDRLLLETDAPYLAPVPYRGKRNEPSYIVETAKKISELKNISIEEVAVQTCRNTQELFGLEL